VAGNGQLSDFTLVTGRVEVNPAAGEIGPLATVFILTETETRPALFLGTSSDRIGSPEGTQGYYLTGSKHIPGTPFGPYATIHYSEWDEGLNFPFGVTIEMGYGFSLRPMYDGERSHLTANYFTGRFGASLLYIWLERFGAAVSVGLF
jgi:hypothetical protein